jgi:hypothetical protein
VRGPNIGVVVLAFANQIWNVRCGKLCVIHSLDMGKLKAKVVEIGLDATCAYRCADNRNLV